MKQDHLFSLLLILALGAGLGVMLVFSAAPELDLSLSKLFLGPEGTFPPSDGAAAVLNRSIKGTLETLAFVIVVSTLLVFLVVRTPESGARNWVYLAGNLVLAPGLLVNGVFKAHFGRARPAHIMDFGGTAHFTPVAEISDQCLKNCSFTSGEAALVASLVFAILPLIWLNLSQRGQWVAVCASAALIAFASGLRVYLGRHFTSDVLMSIVFSALIALALYALLHIGKTRKYFVLPLLQTDLRRFLSSLRGLADRFRR